MQRRVNGAVWAARDRKDREVEGHRNVVGRSGELVDSTPFARKVPGSNPAITVMAEPWANPLLAVACGALARNSDRSSVLCRERF